jgi:hypothetical protein
LALASYAPLHVIEPIAPHDPKIKAFPEISCKIFVDVLRCLGSKRSKKWRKNASDENRSALRPECCEIQIEGEIGYR